MKITEKGSVSAKTQGLRDGLFFEAGFNPPDNRCTTHLDPATPDCAN